MAIQYGPPSLPIRYGSGTAGTATQPLLAGSFASAFARKKPGQAPVSQTLAQAAQARVNAQINPQVAAQNTFNQQQNAAIQGFAQALLGKLQPIAGQVGAGYDSAIQQTGALSNQAAQYLQNANPSGQVADLLRSAGAPQSQQDQIAGQLGQTFGGGAGVLAFTGGAIPGGQLAADKASSMAQAAQLPGLAALKGQQDLASALAAQGQARQQLEAQRPGLYQAASQDIRQNNQARQTAGATAQYRAATLGEKQHEFDVTTADKRAVNAATQAAKKSAAEFLQWYKTEGLNQSAARINQKATEFGVTSGQKADQIAISQQNANTSTQRANAPKVFGSSTAGYQALTNDGRVVRLTGPQKKAPRIFGSASGGYYAITPNGRVGQIVAGKSSAGKAKTLSAHELKDTTAEISNTVTGLSVGGKDPTTGADHPALSREDALKFLQDQGYMATSQMAAITVRKLNEIYGRIAKVKSTGPLGVRAQATP